MIQSVERINARIGVTPAGRMRSISDPIIVALGTSNTREGDLFCTLLLVHADLIPGEYELSDGGTYTIPEEYTGSHARIIQNALLKGVKRE